MKRKFLVVLFAIVAALCMAFGLAACGESTNTGNTGSGGTHEHSWGSWRTVTEAECEKAGVKRRSCTVCNQTEEEPIPALRHNLTDIRIKLPTCTEKGSTTGVCTVCGKTATEETPAYGHLLTEHKGVQATCTTAGTKQYWSCSRCYLNFADQDGQSRLLMIEIAALGHAFETYTSNGDATCTKNGTETAICTRCSEQNTREVKDSAFGHEWDDGVVTQPATCTTAGVRTFTCAHDPDHHKTEVIEANPTAHEYGNWVPQIDATCTKEGELGHYQCAYCRNYFDRTYQPLQRLTIEKRPHQYGEWQEEIPTSCTAPGRKGYHECESCHLKYDKQDVLIDDDDLTIEQIDHNYELDHVVKKTCQEPCYVVEKCSMCQSTQTKIVEDISLTAQLTKMSGASLNGYGTFDNTYTVYAKGGYGTLQYRAEFFQNTANDSPSKVLDYSENSAFTLKWSGYDASAQWTLKVICKDIAGNMTSARFSLRVDDLFVGFDDNGEIIIRADLACLEQKVDEAHNSQGVKTDPTCTEQGYTTYTCADCGKNYVDDYTDPLGHEYQNDVCIRCSQHTGLLYAKSGDHYIVVDIGTCTETEIVIAEKYEGLHVTEIANGAFRNCDKLTSVKIPGNITKIGKEAFYDCDGLTEVTVPDSVTEMGDHVFDGCSNLQRASLGSGLKTIPAYTFRDCRKLSGFTIREGVTSIGGCAFYDCLALESVTIPASVKSIGSNAFGGSGLKKVTFAPNSELTSIGDLAFDYCDFTEITIPKNVTSIGYHAFWNCDKLVSVTFEDPSGWWVSTSSYSTSGADLEESHLQDKSIAAVYLSKTYADYYWKKKA